MTHNKNDLQKGYTFARSNLIAVFLKWTRLDKRGMLCFSWPAGSTLNIDVFLKNDVCFRFDQFFLLFVQKCDKKSSKYFWASKRTKFIKDSNKRAIKQLRGNHCQKKSKFTRKQWIFFKSTQILPVNAKLRKNLSLQQMTAEKV